MPNETPTEMDCPKCHGTGEVPGMSGKICDLCNGTGKRGVTHYPPDTNPYKQND